MKVNVLFFGLAHDLTGFRQEQVEIGQDESLDDLWHRYEDRFPRLREWSGALLAAVNQEVVDRSRRLQDGDEVAFMPPVSGGTDDDFYQITCSPILTHELTGKLKAPADGAVVVFEGIVRDNSMDRRTLYLEYEAYEPLAVRAMQEIGREAKEKFPIDHMGMIHRIGRLEIGETSVAIIVTSAHRGAAFEACRFAIDRLKQTVPIWKKEYFEGGEVWAEGEGKSSFQPSAVSLQPSRAAEEA